jgi:hypothetical protein
MNAVGRMNRLLNGEKTDALAPAGDLATGRV